MSQSPWPGGDENTPSRSEYFTWINHTNEGATEEQTRCNLEFFRFLREEFGMELDIYAFDAGAYDGRFFYGNENPEHHKKHFPSGFAPLAELAGRSGTRLGIWGGPDGFGNTPEEAEARIEAMSSLCRKYRFELFKFDAVCGQLRRDKIPYFIRMMQECRKYSPDLILLNHRLDLHEGQPYATTFLWEGAESYTDVNSVNTTTAPHHRAKALSRGLVPGMRRTAEDHGVCLSSSLEGWADELILQAFNRALLVAPEIYGNPWLLRDDELPTLARIFVLHRKYRKLLVSGFALPEETSGPFAVSRGNEKLRFLTFRNLSWTPRTYDVVLDESIGLAKRENISVKLFHPYEEELGSFRFGEKISIAVQPYRAVLLAAGEIPADEPRIEGVPFRVIRALPDRFEAELLLEPGSRRSVTLSHAENYSSCTLDGVEQPQRKWELVSRLPAVHHGKTVHIATLTPCAEIPEEIQLNGYQTAVFAADNNALEVRSLARAGKTVYPAVQRARDAFFSQPYFRSRGLWDRFLFDNDPATDFRPSRRFGQDQCDGIAALRIDLGAVTQVAFLELDCVDNCGLEPFQMEEYGEVRCSCDLVQWERVLFAQQVCFRVELNRPVRYLRFRYSPNCLRSLKGYAPDGTPLNTASWRVSNLFAADKKICKVWSHKFRLPETFYRNSQLAVALEGVHGAEGAYVVLKHRNTLSGCPDRAPAFPYNPWECVAPKSDANYTYFYPLAETMQKEEVEVFVLGCDEKHLDYRPELYLCCPPEEGFERIRLLLTR